MHITINNLTIHSHGAPSLASMLGDALASAALKARQADQQAATDAPSYRPVIGQEWPGQGGIYAGDFRGGDGTVYGLIVAPEQGFGRASWAPSGGRDLSDWDGLANTQSLRNDCPAAKLASEYQRDGHTDFYLPARREMLLAAANVPDKFGKEYWYWTSTPHDTDCAWAVDFEDGDAVYASRDDERHFRPFRRFVY